MGHKSKKDKDKDHGSTGGLNERQNFDTGHRPSQQVAGDADPGVISEGESEDDFMVNNYVFVSELQYNCYKIVIISTSILLCVYLR